jgi:hypothetical protein
MYIESERIIDRLYEVSLRYTDRDDKKFRPMMEITLIKRVMIDLSKRIETIGDLHNVNLND